MVVSAENDRDEWYGVGSIRFCGTGISQMRLNPAYNPYAEPSMEIFPYHPDLKKWTEIGDSGEFCPEMLQPIGLPEGVCVIAWVGPFA